METTYEKVDDTTLKVIKPIVTKAEENTYDLDFLKQREISILKEKNDFIELRNKELEEVRTLIAKCEELGVKSITEVALSEELIKEEIIK